jgi:hypothetical protein
MRLQYIGEVKQQKKNLSTKISGGKLRFEVILPDKPCIPQFPLLIRIRELYLEHVSNCSI